MPIKYNYAMTDADIESGIASVGKRSKSLREDIHKLSVSILKAWATSGDAGAASKRASSLLEAADKYKAQAIVNWFAVYASFEYDNGEGSFSYTATTTTVENVQAAKEEPYWQLSPPKPAQPFNLMTKLNTLVDSAKKRRVKGMKEGDDIPQDILDALSAIAEGSFHMEEEGAE